MDFDEERHWKYWANNKVGNSSIPTGRIKYDKNITSPITR